MLKDLKIYTSFRNFSKAEGIYIPAKTNRDISVVGININRPIQRQRFTAAHELCHHLKDASNSYICQLENNKPIEKYANDFAAELLMPIEDFRKKVYEYVTNGYIEDIDILRVSQYFGVSYEACFRRIVYDVSTVKKPSYNTIKNTLMSLNPTYKNQNLNYMIHFYINN